MWILGLKGLKGSLNVSPSSTGLLIRVWNCFFVQRVVTQSLTEVSELIVEISSTLLFS